jgi:hypothetical protein
MKADMGSMREAMIRSCSSFEKSPDEQKPRSTKGTIHQRKTEEEFRWESQEEEKEGQGRSTFWCQTLPA